MKRFLPLLLVITVGLAAAAMIYREPPAPKEVGSYSHNVRLMKPPASPPPIPEAPVLEGQITDVSGVVEYQDASGEWKRAAVGIGLGSDFGLETFGDGRVVVSLSDGSAVRLDKGTLVLFRKLEPKAFFIDNRRGRVYAKVTDRAQRAFTLSAGDGVYQANGSAFQAINEEMTKGIEVYEGQVAVTGQADATARVVSQGYRLYSSSAADRKNEGQTVKLDDKRLSKDAFTSWNRGLDAALAAKPILIDIKAAPAVPSMIGRPDDIGSTSATTDQSTGPLVLTGQATADGLSLEWTVDGIAVDKGFKLLKSLQSTPVYPGSDFVYVPESNAREYLWRLQDGKAYHIRLCLYLDDGTCGAYSNELVLSAPLLAGQPVSGVSGSTGAGAGVTGLTLSPAGGNLVRWTVAEPSSQGFRLMWSKEPGTTYPGRDSDLSQYFADPMRRTASISAFDDAGAYYARVCAFRDGKCESYSNEISVYLKP